MHWGLECNYAVPQFLTMVIGKLHGLVIPHILLTPTTKRSMALPLGLARSFGILYQAVDMIFRREEYCPYTQKAKLLIYGKDLKVPIASMVGILYFIGIAKISALLGFEIIEDLGEPVSTGRYTQTPPFKIIGIGYNIIFVGVMILWKLNMIFDGKPNPLYRVWLLGGLSFMLVNSLIRYFLRGGWITFGIEIICAYLIFKLFGKYYEKRKASVSARKPEEE